MSEQTTKQQLLLLKKLTEKQLFICGKSGKKYPFDLYNIDTDFDKSSGIYIFTKRDFGTDGNYEHTLIYCGKTEDLSTRFDKHHREDDIKKQNANCLCVMFENKDNITEIETDILANNTFICNKVLN